MKANTYTLALLGLFAVATVSSAADAGSTQVIVTNNDVPAPLSNTVTFYTVNGAGATTGKTVVPTGGSGIGGGFFAAPRVLVVPSASNVCVFASDAANTSNDVAAIDFQTHAVVGRYEAAATDSGVANGIGLASNGQYLYASFTSTSTIATFQIRSGCKLSFLGDTFAIGLDGGLVGGMKARGNFLIVTYGDGSIESFDVTSGEPVPHGDAQYSAGAIDDHFPNGIDITKDGHFAIFGDASTFSTIEVSDLSGGKLGPTTAYNVSEAWNSGNVRLSPDESLVYVTNDSGGQVTVAFFNPATGVVTPGCASSPLRGYYQSWVYAGASRSQLPSGTGGLLYVPEFGSGSTSSIGVLQLTASGSTCTLTELATSPIVDKRNPANLLSIETYPGRSF